MSGLSKEVQQARMEDILFLRAQGVTSTLELSQRLGVPAWTLARWLYRRKARGLYPYLIDNVGLSAIRRNWSHS